MSAQGWTPLHVAAGHSSSQAHTIIADLAQGSADLEATDREGRTPLLFALEGNRKEAIDALLHAGVPGVPSICSCKLRPHCRLSAFTYFWHAGRPDGPLYIARMGEEPVFLRGCFHRT